MSVVTVVNYTIFWMESTSAVQTLAPCGDVFSILFHINWWAPYISISIKIHQDKGDVFRAVAETASTVLGASAVASPIRGDLKFHSAPTPLPMAASSDDPGPGGEKRFEPWLDWKRTNIFDEYKHIHVNMLSGLLINSILLPESFFGIRSIILI